MSDALEHLQSLLRARHSCRAFKPDPVERDVIEGILSDAGRVPSWCNAQPWQVIVTSGAATEKFRAAMLHARAHDTANPDFDMPSNYTGARLERRRTCGFQLYNALGIQRGDRAAYAQQMAENYRFFGAPHVALITTPKELGTYGVVDCGGFITAFCLAAQARGIATVPQAAIAVYSDAVRRHFDIEEGRQILCAISFGHSDTEHPANSFRTDRAPLAEVMDWRD